MKLINGERLELKLSNRAHEHFANPNNYTDAIIDEFEHDPYKNIITKHDKVTLDIGANIGLFALHVSPFAEKIICVEPTPGHMAIQKELIEMNVATAKPGKEMAAILHEQSALNSYTGKARFREEPVNFTMNTLSDRPDAYEVECISLFDLCRKYKLEKVDVCKVDIEGSEFSAITYVMVFLVKDIIKKFILETHPRSRESQDHFKKIFEDCGYKTEYSDFNGTIIAYK